MIRKRMIRHILKRFDEFMMIFGIWVADVAPFIFRPLKFFVADRMILACAYQEHNGSIIIFYRPAKRAQKHEIVGSERYPWLRHFSETTAPLSLPFLGEKLFFTRHGGNTKTRYYCIRATGVTGKIYSKIIERRRHATTFQKHNFRFTLKPYPQFFWDNPNDTDFWFSFLAVEDDEKNLIAGIYTGKASWAFGDTDSIPYYIHTPSDAHLQHGANYRATLYAVNRFNWVTHIDALVFQAQ